MLACVEIAAIAVGAVLGAVAIYFSYISWRDRRGHAQFQYVVTTATQLVPTAWAGSLGLVHDGEAVNDPWLMIVRIVNVGDRAIKAEDYETPLKLNLGGSLGVASVNQTGQRPSDLAPPLERDGDSVLVLPTLFNPGDMIELQVLTTGQPKEVELGGRLSEVTYRRLPRLPYPPGSGPEGEMLGLDKFMALVLPVGLALGVAVAFALDKSSSTSTRIAVPIGSVLAGCLFLWRERWLVQRRAMFKPERTTGTPEQTRTTG